MAKSLIAEINIYPFVKGGITLKIKYLDHEFNYRRDHLNLGIPKIKSLIKRYEIATFTGYVRKEGVMLLKTRIAERFIGYIQVFDFFKFK